MARNTMELKLDTTDAMAKIQEIERRIDLISSRISEAEDRIAKLTDPEAYDNARIKETNDWIKAHG